MLQIPERLRHDVASVLHNIAEVMQFGEQAGGTKGARPHIATKAARALLNRHAQNDTRLRCHSVLPQALPCRHAAIVSGTVKFDKKILPVDRSDKLDLSCDLWTACVGVFLH